MDLQHGKKADSMITKGHQQNFKHKVDSIWEQHLSLQKQESAHIVTNQSSKQKKDRVAKAIPYFTSE